MLPVLELNASKLTPRFIKIQKHQKASKLTPRFIKIQKHQKTPFTNLNNL